MILTFRLRSSTRVGQSLLFAGSGSLPSPAAPMRYVDREHWEIAIDLKKGAARQVLNYSYILRNPDGSQSTDWGRDRRLRLADFKADELLVIDSWNHAGLVANAFYTEPFKKVLLAENLTDVPAIKTPD